MNHDKFKTDITCLAIDSKSSVKDHQYTPLEDAVAYYCARMDVRKNDTLDVIVLRLNLFSKPSVPLTLSSFKNRIANMNYEINGKGLARNSEQGKLIGQYMNKLLKNGTIKSVELKGYVNALFGKEIV